MALIECPECKKKVSDTAEACPNCGYPINPQPKNNNFTELGKVHQSKVFGAVVLILGIAFIILSIIKLGLPKAFLTICIAAFFIAVGLLNLIGYYVITCPYCNSKTSLLRIQKTHKCNTCKKISVVDGDHLRTTN